MSTLYILSYDTVSGGASKPRALVRALQMLFLAQSAQEAAASLRPQTADEEALLQLTEREPR